MLRRTSNYMLQLFGLILILLGIGVMIPLINSEEMLAAVLAALMLILPGLYLGWKGNLRNRYLDNYEAMNRRPPGEAVYRPMEDFAVFCTGCGEKHTERNAVYCRKCGRQL